jgi:1,4-alpha-glucan branching enzyme
MGIVCICRLRNAIWSTATCVLLLAAASAVKAGDPLGATPHSDGTTTFRVWAPFVDSVSVKVNGGNPVPLSKEDGHSDLEDTVWTATVSGAAAGDRYRYSIVANGIAREFNDPRALQLSSFDPPNGFGIPGSDSTPESVIVNLSPELPPFNEPSFNTLVIYELHIGSFNKTFTGAAQKLDYLQKLGVNALEIMPITQNPLFPDHHPMEHDWGYDPVQLFAVKSQYGSPHEFKAFVQECHSRHMAVIIDVVYNHMVGNNLLKGFGGFTPPSVPKGIYLYGDERANTPFGPRPDFGRPQVRQYVVDSALLLLRQYGVDGLRVDDTLDIRTYQKPFGSRADNEQGIQLLRQLNSTYREEPKQTGKISIAEDLQSYGEVVNRAKSDPVALEFNSQWDDNFFYTLRGAMTAVSDDDRNLGSIKAALELRLTSDFCSRVIYTENHDKVGHPNNQADKQTRLPALIDVNNPESIFAKKRSTLGAAILLTAPGIPMIFQGQEILETRAFGFNDATDMNFDRANDPKYRGIVQLYRDLIALRRNLSGVSRGLTGQHLNVFHRDNETHTIAYHRWEDGGPGDDVVIVANLSNQRHDTLNLGFPRGGSWHVRFNSGAKVYDNEFVNGDSFDTEASSGALDGLNFKGAIGIGPYSVVVLSQ